MHERETATIAAPTARTFSFTRRRSRIALAAAVLGPGSEVALFGVLVGYSDIEVESATWFTGSLLLATLLHLWFVLGARYELTNSSLRLIHGPWLRSVRLEDVLGAVPLRTLDRGPVVRVDLAYGRRLVLTPADREGFLDALELKQPNLRVLAIEQATRG